MAVADVKTAAPSSISNNASMTIRPDSGDEWFLRSIQVDEGARFELYKTDGITAELVNTYVGGKVVINEGITNDVYYTAKNTSGGSAKMTYDAVQTK